jgi:DeoR/GlpR family transcriptional regulator of sugar metabolism
MAEQAERIVVLTESSKLNRRGAVALLASAQVGELHTDDHVARDVAGELAAAGVLVKTVPLRGS